MRNVEEDASHITDNVARMRIYCVGERCSCHLCLRHLRLGSATDRRANSKDDSDILRSLCHSVVRTFLSTACEKTKMIGER